MAPFRRREALRGYGLVTKVTAADPTTDPTKRSSRALMAPRSTRPADGTMFAVESALALAFTARVAPEVIAAADVAALIEPYAGLAIESVYV